MVTAAHQQITHDWWLTAPHQFDLYISEAVLAEIRAGNPVLAASRLTIVSDLPVLSFSENVELLIEEYQTRLGLAANAATDLPHFAYAVAYRMDFLVTWNCKHIANGQVIKRLIIANSELGWPTPVILTPEELLATFSGEL